MSKKLMSVILVAVLVLSMGTVAMASVSADELPAKADGYNRYYFYMPENWLNEHATTAGIYWWEGTDACSSWPGYVANPTDVEGLYYYDVNQDVTTIIWNNAIDGGTDPEAPGCSLAPRDDGKPVCDREKCVYCTLCAKKCPQGAITVDRAGKVWSCNYDECVACGLCIESCPKKALE